MLDSGAEWPDDLDVDELAANSWRPFPFRQFVLKLHGRCNLRCSYCYIYEMGDLTWRSRSTPMSVAVLERACQRIADHVKQHRLGQIDVVFHGGEPLLAGPRLLARAATTLRALLPAGTELHLSVQTNGVLLDETILETLLAHQVRVGLSLDGDRTAHDRHRRYANGRGSYDATTQALELLNLPAYQDLFSGLLCVIDLGADPIVTYETLLSFGPPTVDFLLPHGNWATPPVGRGIDSDETPYGDWLVEIFDRWYTAPRREVNVRIFAEIINLVLGGASRSESVGLSPVALIVVDVDGSMEQVDTLRSVYHGAAATGMTIFDRSFDDLLGHPSIIARQIGLAALGETCRACSVVKVCGGGYYPHRYRPGSGFRNESVYCADLRLLIDHVANRVHQDLDRLRKRENDSQLPTVTLGP